MWFAMSHTSMVGVEFEGVIEKVSSRRKEIVKRNDNFFGGQKGKIERGKWNSSTVPKFRAWHFEVKTNNKDFVITMKKVLS